MLIKVGKFGESQGGIVNSYSIVNNNGMELKCINFGCIITDIKVPDLYGNIESVVIGFDNLEDYFNYSQYFGAVIGRVAGRIKGGQFELNGEEYNVPLNEGHNHLHGGFKGFSNRLWKADIIRNENEAGVEFSLSSADGDEGYPGHLIVKVQYILNNQNELIISYYGIADQNTLVNITNHSYFNLSGNLKRDILNHDLILKSDRYLELDNELLPTGKSIDVIGTTFDFRNESKILNGVNSLYQQNQIVGNGYDHPFLLSTNNNKEIILKDRDSGRQLVIETDEPCVVFYTGNQLKDNFQIKGVQSRKYLGLCLETQGVPDAIHYPHFPSIILEKGQIYLSKTKYTFGLVNKY
jgi:aldose 1-epimerase